MSYRHLKVVVFGPQNPVTPGIVERYSSIVNQAFHEDDPNYASRLKNELTQSHPRSRLYLSILMRDHPGHIEVLGGARLVFSESSRSLYLGGFAIDPSLHGGGLGSFLFNNTIQQFERIEPKARFLVGESVTVRPTALAKPTEDREISLKRARLWERLGFRRVELPGTNRGVDGSEWDVRIKELGQQPPTDHISALQLQKILIDVHRNPLLYTFHQPAGNRLRLSPAGKVLIGNVFRHTLLGHFAPPKRLDDVPRIKTLPKRPRIPHHKK